MHAKAAAQAAAAAAAAASAVRDTRSVYRIAMLAGLWSAVAGSWKPVETGGVCDLSDSPWGASSLAAAHKEKGQRSGSRGHLPEDALDALPPHAKTASACLPLAEVGIAMWIAAPPGAGKSSTAYRLRRYGFLAVDGEDHGLWPAYCERATPGRCDQLQPRLDVVGLAINATVAALHDGVALAVGAAGLGNINGAPWGVMKVILLPDRATYTARWLARQDATPGYTDLQPHDRIYNGTEHLLATEGEKFVAVKDPATDNCVDASLIRLCNGVLKRFVTPPKADASTALAELCFYCGRASPQWALYPYCRSRCNATD